MAEAAIKLPEKSDPKTKGSALPSEWPPFETLRREVDRLFDNFGARSWGVPFGRAAFDIEPFWRGQISWGKVPAVDIVEKDNAYEVTAELPGWDESNVHVGFSDGTLTIKGEKKEEKEEKKEGYYLSERHHGSFQRAFHVPNEVDADKIDAKFKNGVLTVTLPKSAETVKSEKKIAIKKA